MTYRLGIALASAAMAIMAPTALVDPPAACASPMPTVAVVIVGPDGAVRGDCVYAGVGDGLEALRAATGSQVETRDYGGRLGMAVCRIEGEGNPVTECPGVSGHWHYWRLVGGKWIDSDKGPSNTRPKAGEVEGWVWTTGAASSPPAISSHADVCGPQGIGGAVPEAAGPLEELEPGPEAAAIGGFALGVVGLVGYNAARRRRRLAGR